MPAVYTHPQFARRTMLQAGAIGILGLGMNHIEALWCFGGERASAEGKVGAIYNLLPSGARPALKFRS